MRRNHDQEQAELEAAARWLLLERGADQLERRPWRPAPVPPSAVDLVQFAVWKAGDDREAVVAALELMPAARAEIDELEAGLLFTARSLGLTWAEMARALGLNSPQACRQRWDRLAARQGDQP
ncbi:hypothetical protein AB0E69_17160 [Kribbella sp. NPDC026611]|uniref:hypothetical protein n=1 Tax=Kribbella sp. NPDC026611 TaxID=3154911 RepID=UPI0033F3EE23